jgi:Holliday junction resolvase
MGAKSRNKGKVGEREVAELLRQHGIPARRGVQFQGGADSPDVVGLAGFHLEVKRTEAFRLYAAMEQAKSDRKPGDIPAVFHRANQRPWVVVLDAADFLTLVKAAARMTSTEAAA